MKEGWICPRCGLVNTPEVSHCSCRPDFEKLKARIRTLQEVLLSCRNYIDWYVTADKTPGEFGRMKNETVTHADKVLEEEL